MREGEYYAGRRKRREKGQSQRTRKLAAYEGLLFVSLFLPLLSLFQREKPTCACVRIFWIAVYACVVYACSHVLFVFIAIMYSYEEAYACMAYSRTGDTRTGRTNYSISRGENNPTRRALIRACVPTNTVATEDPRGCSNTCVSRPYALVPPVQPLPPSSCYCCDLMKCYARSPAITFPLHRLTPHSTGLVSRGGTVGHLSSLTIPGATASIEDFCTSLKATDRTMPI